jgi:hypothetical protein
MSFLHTVTRRRFIEGSAAAAGAAWLSRGGGPCAAGATGGDEREKIRWKNAVRLFRL